ncbi:MAG: hypothetical protein HC913_14955 [Microscillaceae bacterium]|nr:hypothetical protein [Microscillaceae bacterium]
MKQAVLAVKVPENIKNRVVSLVFQRKLRNEPKATQSQVLLELIEQGLQLMETETTLANEVV